MLSRDCVRSWRVCALLNRSANSSRGTCLRLPLKMIKPHSHLAAFLQQRLLLRFRQLPILRKHMPLATIPPPPFFFFSSPPTKLTSFFPLKKHLFQLTSHSYIVLRIRFRTSVTRHSHPHQPQQTTTQ